ncbi:Oidioi.mRNA.OKI2018_I69.chr2.g4870.t1.cds [Oikopleura dioica]|uniref:Oidioi.mRNA.OKI2018_I69.chr2.g4870.t1.cds n=1 Tax=Oikopleura dioica TaxID=34765 RepID=A0ABN7T5A1_OIKDI|nr:Oidioi.mRNA.OKI2018_I69.chr2.g4870.t1.cds [Oikopleura dioica]
MEAPGWFEAVRAQIKKDAIKLRIAEKNQERLEKERNEMRSSLTDIKKNIEECEESFKMAMEDIKAQLNDRMKSE